MTLAEVIGQYVQSRVRSGENLADVLAEIADELSPAERLDELRRQWWLAATMRGSGKAEIEM